MSEQTSPTSCGYWKSSCPLDYANVADLASMGGSCLPRLATSSPLRLFFPRPANSSPALPLQAVFVSIVSVNRLRQFVVLGTLFYSGRLMKSLLTYLSTSMRSPSARAGSRFVQTDGFTAEHWRGDLHHGSRSFTSSCCRSHSLDGNCPFSRFFDEVSFTRVHRSASGLTQYRELLVG